MPHFFNLIKARLFCFHLKKKKLSKKKKNLTLKETCQKTIQLQPKTKKEKMLFVFNGSPKLKYPI